MPFLRKQEDLIDFFQNVKLSGADAAEAYLDLSTQIEVRFAGTHAYFSKLARAMRIWVDLWRRAPQIKWTPSRRSITYGQRYGACAVPDTTVSREGKDEMVVLRVGNAKQWSDDYRRSVCAIISETHAKRAVYLYTMSDRIQVLSSFPESYITRPPLVPLQSPLSPLLGVRRSAPRICAIAPLSCPRGLCDTIAPLH